jgi:lipopolysaccharide/colanic/teichoic acid biosynthesis glycosyltransferase
MPRSEHAAAPSDAVCSRANLGPCSRRKRLAWTAVIAGASGVKRGLDLLGAGAGLVLLWPVLAGVALAVRLEDGGPVLFRQVRAGRDGKPFTMYKFRSMVVGAEAMAPALRRRHPSSGPTFKLRRDPRLTRVGAAIRRLSLDELPQLCNVLRGEMSLVGPRPALPEEVASYTPAQRRRLAVKPGLTCLWQVSGRSDLEFSQQVALDIQYVESSSLLTDVKILLRTIPAVLSGKGAY